MVNVKGAEGVASRGSFMHGAIILVIAGFINKVIGFLYRIFAVRVVGAEGIGLYEMVIPAYSLILVITTAGVPLAISKLVSEHLSLGRLAEARKVFRIALVFLICSGFASVLLVFALVPFLVGNVFADPRVYWCLITLSPALFITSVSAAFRGYFQGLQQMVPPAVGQVTEQIFRVSAGVILASIMYPHGIEYAVAGLAAGTLLGEIMGLLVLVFIYGTKGKYKLNPSKGWKSHETQNTRAILRNIFTFSVPVSLSRLVNSLLLTLQAIVIPMRLQSAGYSLRQATELYGQFSGIAISLLGMPTIITLSLATTLVPATSEALSMKNYPLLRSRSIKALQVSLMVGLPSAVLFLLLPEELCQIIFKTPEAGIPLRTMAVGCLFLYLAQTSGGILQGLGKTGITLWNSIAGAVCNIILVYILTGLPTYGIRGTAIAMDIGWLVIAALNLIAVSYLTGITFNLRTFLVVPLTGSVIMGIFIYILTLLLWTYTHNSLVTTLGAMAGGGISYFVYLFLSGTIKKEDLAVIPFIGGFFNSGP